MAEQAIFTGVWNMRVVGPETMPETMIDPGAAAAVDGEQSSFAVGCEPAHRNVAEVQKFPAIASLQRLVTKYSGEAAKVSPSQLKSEFEAMIKLVDGEYAEANESFNREMTALQPVLAFRLIDVRKATMALEKYLEGMEDSRSAAAERLVACWQSKELGGDERNELIGWMREFPGLLDLLCEIDRAEDLARPISQTIDGLQQNLTYTANHRVKARFAYADALAACGARNRSQDLILQAMSIQMGLPVEELRRSKKRRKEQDRSRRRRAAAG